MSNLLRSCRRIAALLLLVWVVSADGGRDPQVLSARALNGLPCPVDMRLLVISSNGQEAILPAIKETLEYLGTPYDLHIAAEPGVLTAAMLASGPCQGNYQGIMLTNGELGYARSTIIDGKEVVDWVSALSPDEWAALRQYEATFKVRQATWYTYPQPAFGYNIGYAVDTGLTPLTSALTADGAKVFSYLNPATPITISQAYGYLATPLGAGVTPLLVTPDGHALALINIATDGREELSLTFDGNKNLLHTITLGYGLVHWVTRGVFLGERRAYMSPQVDDFFLRSDQWVASTACGTALDQTGYQYRNTASDVRQLLIWQRLMQTQPTTRTLKMTIAYNGAGAVRGYAAPDDLTPYINQVSVKRAFHWVSHTFTHTNLDTATAAMTRSELNNNNRTAATLRLPGFTRTTLVTPEVSGLKNPVFLKAAFNLGVRYVVSDTSRPGENNPTPNTGIVNSFQPGIFMIPRYPTNLFYNVASPDGWASEYNCMYRGYWGRDLSYSEILDIESQRLLTYLLKGDMNPWMFHQPNVSAYDGVRTLMTDLLEVTIVKYNAITNLPILSPPMQQIGAMMKARAAYNSSGVRATWNPDGSVTIRVAKKAVVPVTGLPGAGAAQYGGQPILRITVTPRAPVTVFPNSPGMGNDLTADADSSPSPRVP